MKTSSGFPARSVLVLALILLVRASDATTNMWYPSTSATFSGWPTNWVAVPSLNDPRDLSANDGRIDFVGDSINPCGYWSSNTNYFFIRMRVAISNVTSTTFRDSHWIYIDRVGYTNGAAAADMPDYALVWDSKNNDPTKHGLELQTGTNLTATTYWSQMSLADIDDNTSQKIAPPDFNLTGDGYIRTIDMRPTTNFGYTTFIDFAVRWSFIAANTALNTNQTWRLQFGTRNDANDHTFPQDDIAGGFGPSSVVTNSWSAQLASRYLSARLSLSLHASTSGVLLDLWTVSESGFGDIVVFAWIEGQWTEVARVPSSEVVGEGDNHYSVSATGLQTGQSYLLRVVDESGHEFVLPEPVTVKEVRMNAIQLELKTLSISFNTEPGKYYIVKAAPTLTAPDSDWIPEPVRHLRANGWSELSSQPFAGGDDTKAHIQVPAHQTLRFFKIIMRDP